MLRPRYGPIVPGLTLATLFVPSVTLLVPLYLTLLDPPVLRTSLIKRSGRSDCPRGRTPQPAPRDAVLRQPPREIFEAARVDGAGPFRLFVSIVLPMSRPILGVVSIFAVIAAWKDFLWLLLVLPNPDLQPLFVRLPAPQRFIELDVFLAALAVSTIIPVPIFLAFQRMVLRSAGLGGAI